MSRLRIRRRDETEPPTDPPDYSHVPYSSPAKRSRSVKAKPTIWVANGQRFVQTTSARLPVPRGQVAILERPKWADDSGTGDPLREESNGGTVEQVASLPSLHHRKRVAQNNRWNTEVIPLLVRPYLQLLRETQNLRDEANLFPEECTCMGAPRLLSVIVICFQRTERVELMCCACRSAAVQLVKLGLFPCAPLYPTLAADIRVLNFVTRLFLRIAPNNTAWSQALAEFLDSQGYQFHGTDPLRRRFASALQWYNVLQNATESLVDSVLAAARPVYGLSEVNQQEDSNNNEDIEDDEAIHSLHLRPSEYLRTRCPICFGGTSSTMRSDLHAIVCLDACFTQKNNKQKMRDPPREHPKSSFIPESDVEIWKEFVEQVRHTDRPKRKSTTSEINDGFEGGLKVPNSVLDSCENSFTAADENRQKASTQFFDSTALMGLLCRHDRVLWLVNMTSPGERQHYAFALIEKLFQHLPQTWSIGILYDVACTLHRSCVKWDFLKCYVDRISFAISVFHAYGHGWACQCVYHPRKRTGFGLSDGEGCERFWHSISRLVAYLRVCGHHLRLYTLDSQVQHGERESLLGLGKWIARKWVHATAKRSKAAQLVHDSGYSPVILREQWDLQVQSQTKPLPRRSKNAGKKGVEEALRLRKAIDAVSSQVSRLEDICSDLNSEAYEITDAEGRLPKLREKLQSHKSALRRQERALGVEDMAQYRHLLNSPYIQKRMETQALKLRLREKLRARKFERERVERSMRRQQYNDRKLAIHVEDSVKRKDPTIQNLTKQYNKLCEELAALIRSHRAPRNSVAPRQIPSAKLWDLDVDDEIWQDVGLDEGVHEGEPPLWLSNEKVRQGIRGVLDLDRCDEELTRLMDERRTLREWMREEWQVVGTAIETAIEQGNLDLRFQLERRKQHLLRLCVVWDSAMASLPPLLTLVPWGPTQEELQLRKEELNAEVVSELIQDDDDAGSETDVDDAELDSGLVERIDALNLITEESDVE